MELQPKFKNYCDSETLVPVDQRHIELPCPLSHSSVYEESQVLYYLLFLRKHGWSILATCAIVFSLSVISTLRATRLYQATSKVAISPANPDILGLKNFDGMPDYDFDEELETEAAILRSEALAAQVISTMHLDRDSRFSGTKPLSPNADEVVPSSNIETDSSKMAALLGALRGGL